MNFLCFSLVENYLEFFSYLNASMFEAMLSLERSKCLASRENSLYLTLI